MAREWRTNGANRECRMTEPQLDLCLRVAAALLAAAVLVGVLV